jgi:DHA2 family multidrug resistance protein-like MFS transporter
MGSKRPMLLGTFIVIIGIALISLVFLPGIEIAVSVEGVA